MKLCPKCGFEVESSEDFCGNCGFNFGSVDLSDKTQFLDRRQPFIQPLEDMIPDEPQTDVAKEEPTEPPKKKSKAPILILVIIGVLIIAVGTLYLLESKDIINFLDGIGSDKADEASSEASTDESGNVIYSGDIILSGETESIWVIESMKFDTGSYKEFSYDKYGNLCNIKDYNSSGKNVGNSQKTYNEKGYLIKSETETYYEDKKMSACYEYTYDENGNTMTYASISGDSQEWIYRYTYDADGNMLTEKMYRDDAVSRHFEYTYDTEGKMLKKTEYDTDGSMYYCEERTYDENGKLNYAERRDNEGSLLQKYEYTYDDKGNLLTVFADGLYGEYSLEYAYDSNGNKLSEIRYNKEKTEIKSKTEYTWIQIDAPIEYAENIRDTMNEY